ncbi:hypothetical protein F4677DRAFT_441067 [Hypoxylon crocopeplum]|nr:hypothetical protein F4677DRAFT_441067 [Hypoxylon crocopeplum]
MLPSQVLSLLALLTAASALPYAGPPSKPSKKTSIARPSSTLKNPTPTSKAQPLPTSSSETTTTSSADNDVTTVVVTRETTITLEKRAKRTAALLPSLSGGGLTTTTTIWSNGHSYTITQLGELSPLSSLGLTTVLSGHVVVTVAAMLPVSAEPGARTDTLWTTSWATGVR